MAAKKKEPTKKELATRKAKALAEQKAKLAKEAEARAEREAERTRREALPPHVLREERRLVLARLAAGVDEKKTHAEKLEDKRKADLKQVDKKHKAALKKVKDFERGALAKARSELKAALSAQGELMAQHVDRGLVSAENGARALVNRIARGVEAQKRDLANAKEVLKIAKKKGTEVTRQVKDQVAEAQSRLQELVQEGEEASKAWEKARDALSKAAKAAFSTSERA